MFVIVLALVGLFVFRDARRMRKNGDSDEEHIALLAGSLAINVVLIKGMIEHQNDNRRQIEEQSEQKGFAVNTAEAKCLSWLYK